MAHSSLRLRGRRWVAILFGGGALAIGACSSPDVGPWFSGGHSPTQASHGSVLPPPPQATFTFYPISFNQNNNQATAIDDENYVTGVYATSGEYTSFTGQCPFKSKDPRVIDCSGSYIFATPDHVPGDGLYFNANDNTDPKSYAAGYIGAPTSSQVGCTTCGVLYDENTKSQGFLAPLIEDPGDKSCKVTKLLAINNAKIAVGYYETGTTACTKQAFEEYLFNNGQTYVKKFVDFTVSGLSNTVATGIDNGGDVIGTGKSVAGVTEGWYYFDGGYTVFHLNTLTSKYFTQPTGISWNRGIVGTYSDSVGTHGFLLTTANDYSLPTTVTTTGYQSIDYPRTNGVTSINGITPSYWILAGWYQTSSGTQGFIASCTLNCPTPGPLGASDSTSRTGAKPRTGPIRSAGSRP